MQKVPRLTVFLENATPTQQQSSSEERGGRGRAEKWRGQGREEWYWLLILKYFG